MKLIIVKCLLIIMNIHWTIIITVYKMISSLFAVSEKEIKSTKI